MCQTLMYELRSQANAPPACWSKKPDQQCRFKKIADVLKAITWGQIPGLDDIHDMDDGGPYTEDSHGNDGGFTEAIAPTHGDNTKNTDCQIGEPTSSWKGFPVGQPMDSATGSEMKK